MKTTIKDIGYNIWVVNMYTISCASNYFAKLTVDISMVKILDFHKNEQVMANVLSTILTWNSNTNMKILISYCNTYIIYVP